MTQIQHTTVCDELYKWHHNFFNWITRKEPQRLQSDRMLTKTWCAVRGGRTFQALVTDACWEIAAFKKQDFIDLPCFVPNMLKEVNARICALSKKKFWIYLQPMLSMSFSIFGKMHLYQPSSLPFFTLMAGDVVLEWNVRFDWRITWPTWVISPA